MPGLSGGGVADFIIPYATGTWTPTFTGATVVGSPTYTGSYTKIGRTVFYTITLTCSVGNTVASTAGTTFCDNFPFSVVEHGTGGVTNATSIANLAQVKGGTGATRIYPGTFAAQTEVTYISGWVVV